MNTNTTHRENVIITLRERMLPGADDSRTRTLNRVLNSLSDGQLNNVEKAVKVAHQFFRVSKVRDAIESRNLMQIEAIAKWEMMIDLDRLETELNRCFNEESDRQYDIYSDAFQAHIEASAIYHNDCGQCTAYDADMADDEGYDVPFEGHYSSYDQDWALIELVEQYPDRVAEVVKFVTERRTVDEVLLEEYLFADTPSLSGGLL